MILEAFAKYLQAADPTIPAPMILSRWLWERLTSPPESLADHILRSEIAVQIESKRSRRAAVKGDLVDPAPGYFFKGGSDSGRRLLKALSEYAGSYEQQKWSRWVHAVKASDFNRLYNNE